jgi:arylsulfatase
MRERSQLHRLAVAAATGLILLPALVTAQQSLPQLLPPFAGKIDPDRAKSVTDWPKNAKAPAGAPNVVLILLDDVGFGASSTFGGAAYTPELDKLAAAGLKYNRFHVNALCSPKRPRPFQNQGLFRRI